MTTVWLLFEDYYSEGKEPLGVYSTAELAELAKGPNASGSVQAIRVELDAPPVPTRERTRDTAA